MSKRFVKCAGGPVHRVATAAIALVLLCAAPPTYAQRAPITWSAEIVGAQVVRGKPFTVAIHATIPYGWHLYSPKQPRGGPIATAVEVGNAAAFRTTGPLAARVPDIAYDSTIAMRSETYTDSVTFTVPVIARDRRSRTLLLDVSYQACTVRYCTPPTATRLSIPIASPPPSSTTRQ